MNRIAVSLRHIVLIPALCCGCLAETQHRSAWTSVSEGTLRKDYVIKKVMPEFPATASEAGIQGLVAVIVEFNPEGELTRVALNPQASRFAAPTRDQIVYEASSDWKPRGPFLNRPGEWPRLNVRQKVSFIPWSGIEQPWCEELSA